MKFEFSNRERDSKLLTAMGTILLVSGFFFALSDITFGTIEIIFAIICLIGGYRFSKPK